jgi:hypothetical protein
MLPCMVKGSLVLPMTNSDVTQRLPVPDRGSAMTGELLEITRERNTRLRLSLIQISMS